MEFYQEDFEWSFYDGRGLRMEAGYGLPPVNLSLTFLRGFIMWVKIDGAG